MTMLKQLNLMITDVLREIEKDNPKESFVYQTLTLIQPLIQQAEQNQKELVVEAMKYALTSEGTKAEWHQQFCEDYYDRINQEEVVNEEARL